METEPHTQPTPMYRRMGAAAISVAVHLLLFWWVSPLFVSLITPTNTTTQRQIRIRIITPPNTRKRTQSNRQRRRTRRKRTRRKRTRRRRRRYRRTRRRPSRRRNQRRTTKRTRLAPTPPSRSTKPRRITRRSATKRLRQLDLRPNMRTWGRISRGKTQQGQRAGSRQGIRRRYPKDKQGYRHIAHLWPGYHREFKGRQKAMNGLHHPFYEQVAVVMRRCWDRLKPKLVKQYNRRYNMAQRQVKGKTSYRGHMRMVWRTAWPKPRLIWALPRASSPVRNVPLVHATKQCFRTLDIPASLKQRKRVLEAKWSFHIKIGVDRPKIMAPLEIRKDPDRKPDTNPRYARAFVDLGSLANMWITKAHISIMTTAVYR